MRQLSILDFLHVNVNTRKKVCYVLFTSITLPLPLFFMKIVYRSTICNLSDIIQNIYLELGHLAAFKILRNQFSKS